VVAHISPKNQFREPKKIPYAVPIYEPDTPSWSSCEYSFTPSILSIKEEVVYPWEIDVAVSSMTDVEERRMAKIKMTALLRGANELLAAGTAEDSLRSTSGTHRSSVEVEK